MKMSNDVKATTEIIIREVQDIIRSKGSGKKKVEQIEDLLQKWTEANDLHPENVTRHPDGTYSLESGKVLTRRRK